MTLDFKALGATLPTARTLSHSLLQNRPHPYNDDSLQVGATLLPAFILSRESLLRDRPHPCDDVPPEVWAIVGKFSTRGTLARLCRVSSHFYGIFTPMLYEDPLAHYRYGPVFLSASRVMRLIQTLSTCVVSSSPSLEPRPVHCVRNLRMLPYILGKPKRISEEVCERMLRHLGAGLRALSWDMEFRSALVPRALKLLPNLTEVCVTSCTEDLMIGMQLLRIPNLEKVTVCLSFDPENSERWGPAWSELGNALKILASSSPLLKTLDLRFLMDVSDPHWRYLSSEYLLDLEWGDYTELQTTINSLRFPVLHTLSLSSRIHGTRRAHKYAVDLSPFLHAHGPTLSDVTLTENGMLWDAKSISLPALRSFEGSIEHCNVILECADALERVSLRLRADDGYNWSDTGVPFPANAGPCVNNVYVGDHRDDMQGLLPTALETLVAAFPNMRDLDVALAEDVAEHYASVAMLHSLERLHIRQKAPVPYEHREQTASFLYPLVNFTTHVETLLASSPHLSSVQFQIEGTRVAKEGSWCDSCGHFSGDGEPKWPPDETYLPLEVGMDFLVRGGEVVLGERREVDVRKGVLGYGYYGLSGDTSEDDSEGEEDCEEED